MFWNTPEHTLHPHSCPVATATLLMGQPLPLLPAPGSRGIFTTHYYFEAQFLLHCTGCLLSIEFLKINLTVASIKKKDVTGFVCCNADIMRFSPYNNQHHISSHLISHHCHTAFPSILPGTKRRAALRTVSLKKDTMEHKSRSLPEDLYKLHLRLPVLASGTNSDNNPANLGRTVRAKPRALCHRHHCCSGPQGKCCPQVESINSRIIHFSQ